MVCYNTVTKKENTKELNTMANAQNPIYVVVRTEKKMTEPRDFYIYTKSSSNKEVMIAYAKEIQAKHPTRKVYLMTREKAKEQRQKFYQWYKANEAEKMARCERNLNKLMGRMVYADSTKRVAQR